MDGCPVFHPTLADVNGTFESYIEKIEGKIAKYGIAKIIAPAGWDPRRQGYAQEDIDLRIERPIRQHATGRARDGIFRMLYIEQKPMSLRDDFQPQALAPDNNPPSTSGSDDKEQLSELERRFWKNVTLRPPLYGADIEGSLFDETAQGWNLRRLDTVLSQVLQESGHSLPGVSTPYLYFGMWRSIFAWHCEDMDLYSVNYLHYGAPKSWYCIPPEHRKRFETLVKGLLPDLFRACPEFLRHKELLVSPQLLDQYRIPYVKVVQRPREFIINFPGAYHAGFNHGYNCAESVNFATRKWIPFGARAGICQCHGDSVKIDMKLFRHLVPARQLPSELFEDSSEDEDYSSEDGSEASSDQTAVATPSPRRRMGRGGSGAAAASGLTGRRRMAVTGASPAAGAAAGRAGASVLTPKPRGRQTKSPAATAKPRARTMVAKSVSESAAAAAAAAAADVGGADAAAAAGAGSGGAAAGQKVLLTLKRSAQAALDSTEPRSGKKPRRQPAQGKASKPTASSSAQDPSTQGRNHHTHEAAAPAAAPASAAGTTAPSTDAPSPQPKTTDSTPSTSPSQETLDNAGGAADQQSKPRIKSIKIKLNSHVNKTTPAPHAPPGIKAKGTTSHSSTKKPRLNPLLAAAVKAASSRPVSTKGSRAAALPGSSDAAGACLRQQPRQIKLTWKVRQHLDGGSA